MSKKPRKWSNLKGQVPAAPGEDNNERLQRIQSERAKHEGKNMAELAAEWAALDREFTAATLAEKERNIKYDALEPLILAALDQIQALASTDIYRGPTGTFSPRYKPLPTVTDRPRLLQWIRDIGQADRLVTDLPGATLSDIIEAAYNKDVAALLTPAERAALQPGFPGSMQPPPGVNVYLKTAVGRTGADKPVKDEEE